MNFRLLLVCICFPFSLYGGSVATQTKEKERLDVKMSIQMIDWYKANIAPHHSFGCSYYPSCSQYTKEAIQKYGLIKGWLFGCDRLMRCNHDLWVYSEVKVGNELKKYNPIP